MKKENYLKQDFTVPNLVQNKNVSLPLSFFFNKSSISKLTFLFLGKFSSLLFLITRLSVGLPLSPVSKIEGVEDSPEVDKQRLGGTFTQIIFLSNFSLLLSPSEVPGTEFLYFKRYLPFDDNSVFAEISIVFNFSFIFREMKHKVRISCWMVQILIDRITFGF